MLAKAETSERRQKKLEHFFREAYALTFGLRPGERRRRSDASVDGEVVTVMRTSLTKNEFASALGMKHDAVFVKKMFNIVDKDGDGRISFQVFIIFLKPIEAIQSLLNRDIYFLVLLNFCKKCQPNKKNWNNCNQIFI